MNWKRRATCRCATTSLKLVALWALAGAFTPGVRSALSNPILFVTQVPIPEESNANIVSNVTVSVVSALGNHLADTAHAGRGGDLWIRYPGGGLTNLTRAAGYGTDGPQHGVGIAVRDPFVHWSGRKAVFSMVTNAPAGPGDASQYFWQLYEITNLVPQGSIPVISWVPNQPPNYNNVMPCYGTDGRIIFVCDRPRDGSAHLYPQLDEYNNIPSNTGLWSLDPATGDLFQLDHSPSGDFNPFVDSFGRVIFTRWDHLVQDRNATDDRLGNTTNGTFNFLDESVTNYDLNYRPIETFPEPRTFDTQQLALLKVQGNAMNSFLPWMQNEDGTGLETLNHVGRHELFSAFRGSSFTNDPNLIQQFSAANRLFSDPNFLNNFLQLREDPLHSGSYFGVDAPDFGTHAAGQIVTLSGDPSLNGEQMRIGRITSPAMKGPNPAGVHRNPLPMSDGQLVACFSPGASLDVNSGSRAFPKSAYAFRLVTLTNTASGIWSNATFLTTGLTNRSTYWSGNTLVTHTNFFWELQPVEVVSRAVPPRVDPTIPAVEAQVFQEEGVDVPAMQSWLRTNQLALLISRDVTARDRADREQPFNLRVPGGVQTIGTNTGPVYDISYLQFYQADQLRGLTQGGTNPVPGRRVLAVPLHDPAATSFNPTNGDHLTGASKLGLDGSQATFLPARRAMTHQTVDNSGNHAVRERFWLTYQPGEIRTCAVCHGLNVADQIGRPVPTNAPAALRDLLRYWKSQTGYTRILSGTNTSAGLAVSISGPTTRPTVLDATTDFLQWTPVATNDASVSGLFWLSDPGSTNHLYRFYRSRVP